MGFVYMFVFPNGKRYIGQTSNSDVHVRWNNHRVRKNHCWAVARAINKYGWENVQKHVLVKVPNNLLDHYEVKFIDVFGSLNPGGYNLTPGGDYNPMDSEDVRAKHLKTMQSDDHRNAQAKHSRAWHNDDTKHASWKEKNAEASRNPEKRNKHREITKATWADQSVREKRTSGLKRVFSDPAVSKKRKDAAAKALRTSEASAKMMAGHALAREAKLAKLPPVEREKKRKDMEKRRDKAREKYRAKHGITHRIVSEERPMSNKGDTSQLCDLFDLD